LDKLLKENPNGLVRRAVDQSGVRAGRSALRNLPPTLGKALAKTLARALPAVAAAAAVADAKAIGETGVESAKTAKAVNDAIKSAHHTHNKFEQFAVDYTDELSDDDLTQYMSRRLCK